VLRSLFEVTTTGSVTCPSCMPNSLLCGLMHKPLSKFVCSASVLHVSLRDVCDVCLTVHRRIDFLRAQVSALPLLERAEHSRTRGLHFDAAVSFRIYGRHICDRLHECLSRNIYDVASKFKPMAGFVVTGLFWSNLYRNPPILV
jgi:hypothetical protein